MFKKSIFLSILIFLSSCTIGINKMKEDNKVNYENKCNLEKNIKISWLGNSPVFITSKNIIGRINRFVTPYTKNTSLLNIEINNNYSDDIIFEPINFYININNENINELKLDYFENKWPTSIVLNTEQLIDQSIAIGEVVRSIVRKKLIDKDAKEVFIIPFEKIDSNKFELYGKFKINEEIKNIYCEFIKK